MPCKIIDVCRNMIDFTARQLYLETHLSSGSILGHCIIEASKTNKKSECREANSVSSRSDLICYTGSLDRLT